MFKKLDFPPPPKKKAFHIFWKQNFITLELNCWHIQYFINNSYLNEKIKHYNKLPEIRDFLTFFVFLPPKYKKMVETIQKARFRSLTSYFNECKSKIDFEMGPKKALTVPCPL